MPIDPQKFAKLLNDGIKHIEIQEGKKRSLIRDELGFALGRDGGSMVEHWGKGQRVPQKSEDVRMLATEIVKRGKVDQRWAEEFFTSAGIRQVDDWLAELFPDNPRPDSSESHINDINNRIEINEEVVTTPPQSEPPLSTKIIEGESGAIALPTPAWRLSPRITYLAGALLVIGITAFYGLQPMLSKQSNPPIFMDNFDAPTINPTRWKAVRAEHLSLQAGRIQFAIPLNNSEEWHSELLELQGADFDYFSRIEFTIRLDSIAEAPVGYVGVQTDCDKGWLGIRAGESDSTLSVESSQFNEEDEDFSEPTPHLLADINPDQDYTIQIEWDQTEATIFLDGKQIESVHCLPTRYLGLFAGVFRGSAVSGSIDDVRIWD